MDKIKGIFLERPMAVGGFYTEKILSSSDLATLSTRVSFEDPLKLDFIFGYKNMSKSEYVVIRNIT